MIKYVCAMLQACHKGHTEVVKEILEFKPNLGLLQVDTYAIWSSYR